MFLRSKLMIFFHHVYGFLTSNAIKISFAILHKSKPLLFESIGMENALY